MVTLTRNTQDTGDTEPDLFSYDETNRLAAHSVSVHEVVAAALQGVASRIEATDAFAFDGLEVAALDDAAEALYTAIQTTVWQHVAADLSARARRLAPQAAYVVVSAMYEPGESDAQSARIVALADAHGQQIDLPHAAEDELGDVWIQSRVDRDHLDQHCRSTTAIRRPHHISPDAFDDADAVFVIDIAAH